MWDKNRSCRAPRTMHTTVVRKNSYRMPIHPRQTIRRAPQQGLAWNRTNPVRSQENSSAYRMNHKSQGDYLIALRATREDHSIREAWQALSARGKETAVGPAESRRGMEDRTLVG